MLTTAEVKAHLRVEFDDDNSLIDNLTQAAYQFAENYTNISILDTEKVDYLDDFQTEITLKNTNVQSITSVTYYDADDVQQSQTDFYLNTRNLRDTLNPVQDESWPDTNQNFENVAITYQAGYATIPEAINQAVLLLVGSMYDQRENHSNISINEIPVSAEYLLNPYRVHAV